MSIAGKKTVFVASECRFHANREIEELLTILEEYTGVKAKAEKDSQSRRKRCK